MRYLLAVSFLAAAVGGCTAQRAPPLATADTPRTTGNASVPAGVVVSASGEVVSTGSRSGDTNVASTGTNGPSTMQPLPGTFVFTSNNLSNLAAVKDGNGPGEFLVFGAGVDMVSQFVLWHDANTGFYAVESWTHHFISALNGGGQIFNAVQITAPQIVDEGLFKLVPLGGPSPFQREYAIQTIRGYYVTAVGGGVYSESGQALHTDATTIHSWESFTLSRCGNLGSGSKYKITTPDTLHHTTLYLAAAGGGGSTDTRTAIALNDITERDTVFTILALPDGSYALQTATGNYVTAIEYDGFHTDATQIGAWEHFKINFVTTNSNQYCLATIQGFNGVNLGILNSIEGPPQLTWVPLAPPPVWTFQLADF